MGRKVKVENIAQPISVDIVKSIAMGSRAGLDSSGLLNSLIRNWGGEVAFTRDVYSEFKAAKPGSMTRQRILEMISRLTITVTAQESSRPRGASDMSDEELEASLEARLRKMANAKQVAQAPGITEIQGEDHLQSETDTDVGGGGDGFSDEDFYSPD